MATTERGIYYQDDYKKAADILADMKKMAESTDDAIKKSEYNDKDVKDSIKEIQDKQTLQDKNIEKNTTKNTQQDELIQKLQSNMINESTEEATSLHVEDASDLPAKLNIVGSHYQKAQEGTSNLAILQEGTIEKDGITVKIENGVGTVSGTNTSEKTTYIEIGIAYLYKDKKYYLKKNSGSEGYSLFKNGKTIWFPDTNETSFAASETGEYAIRFSVGAGSTPKTTFKLSIYEMSGQEWVQGKKAIPSIEYPSEIETVKDNIKIIQCNKNLFKITAKNTIQKGITYKVNDDGTVSATGTSEGTNLFIGEANLKAGTYTISGGPKNGGSLAQRLSIYVSKDGSSKHITSIYGNSKYTYKTEKDVKIKLNYVVQGGITVDNEMVAPQVELGEQATSFIKHEEKEYNLSIQQEMLQNDYFDLLSNKEMHKWKKYTVTSVDNFKVTKKEARFEFEMSVENGNHLSNLVCNMFKKWKNSDYTKTACYISWNSKFIILLQFGDCGFTENMTVEEAKTRFQEIINENTSLIFYYSMITTEELELTEEQKQVLNELQNLELFKGVNNIYTEQDLALLQLNYTADTKMYIDNKISSQKRRANIWKNEIK